jgi:glycosyltransferase involved in cell wall biosynthesis
VSSDGENALLETIPAQNTLRANPSTAAQEAASTCSEVTLADLGITSPPVQKTAGAKCPVTVIVPTLNEAKNLPRCLEALQWADEIVVVDSNSKDETQRISLEYGARVLNFKWNRKWPKKRNWVLEKAELKHPWILIVDADEVIVPELAAEVAEAVKSDLHAGYYINRRFMFLNKWIRHCGYYPSWNLRLLKRGRGEYERLTLADDTGSGDNEVHEHVVVQGTVGRLKSDMLHYAFPDIATFVEKHNRYSNWEALTQFQGTGASHAAVSTNEDLSFRRKLKLFSRRLPFRPSIRFLWHYIFRLGILDGYAGLLFCRLLMMYEFLSVAKYYELKVKARLSKGA